MRSLSRREDSLTATATSLETPTKEGESFHFPTNMAPQFL